MLVLIIIILTVVDCGVLESPLFGEVTVNDTVFESIANYTCQRGYSVNGTSIRLCEGDGQWSDSMPQCIRKIPQHNDKYCFTIVW